MQKEYIVSIELSGEHVPVGTLERQDSSEAIFRYCSNYLSRPNIHPISLSLPLQDKAFSTSATRIYFEGLLPEGFTRRSVAQWMHTSENDYLSILHGLGRECLGAVRISAADDITEASYEKLTLGEVKELASEGAAKSTEIVVQSHLSLTGASGKVGLYYDSKNGEWYFPKGTAPSTHIVKQSHIRLGGIVVNERFTLMVARKCGLDTASCFIINTGAGNDDEILLASQRYDRSFAGSVKNINGMPVPLRLHQEDFAQALGIPSSEKYETHGQKHMKAMFELLRKCSSNPIEDQLKLWDMIIFNRLVGNTDGHIKNFSLIYTPDMKGMRLAPAYDLVSTAVYPSCTRSMAFSVGGENSLDNISRKSFIDAAHEIGLGEKIAMAHFDTICNAFPNTLDAVAEDLKNQGLPGCDNLRDMILKSAVKIL